MAPKRSALRSLLAAQRALQRDVGHHLANAAGADGATRELYEATIRLDKQIERAIARARGERE